MNAETKHIVWDTVFFDTQICVIEIKTNTGVCWEFSIDNVSIDLSYESNFEFGSREAAAAGAFMILNEGVLDG